MTKRKPTADERDRAIVAKYKPCSIYIGRDHNYVDFLGAICPEESNRAARALGRIANRIVKAHKGSKP